MSNPPSLFQKLTSKMALTDAWRVIERKKSAGGIDRQTVQSFEKIHAKEIDTLSEELKSGNYVPQPYARIDMTKPGKPGESRPISLPAIRDKIVQQALKTLVDPLFNKVFLDVSYAYRPGKGSVKAINRIKHIINNTPNKWLCRADIDRFFDTMKHDIALTAFKTVVDEPEITKLLTMWIKIGAVKPEGNYIDSPDGIAQGGIISPLLSNIYLHDLDQFIVEKGVDYVRYADNIIFFSKEKNRIENDFETVKHFLKNRLNLTFNIENRYIYKIENGIAFMGIFFKHGKLFMDHKRKDRMRNRIRSLVNDLFIRNHSLFIKRLRERAEGFEAYYGTLGMEHMYPVFNKHLKQCVIDCLIRHHDKINRKPLKKEIMAQLSEVRLFGDRFGKNKYIWVEETARECLSRYRDNQSKLSDEKKKTEKKSADQLLSKQKSKYRKLENINRELSIKEFGVFVGKTKTNLTVKKRGKNILSVPMNQLSTIDIKSRGVTLSSDVIEYCVHHKISIFFSDLKGMPYCVLQDPQFGDSDLGLLQLSALQDGTTALHIVKEIITGKIRKQINVLKFYKRSRSQTLFNAGLTASLGEFDAILSKIKKLRIKAERYIDAKNTLMGYEAAAAKLYWKHVKVLLANDVPSFPGRRRKGAVDLVNSLLNYGYGFLYRQIWREILLAKLNPKIGFLHAPSGEKPVLVFDLIEEFRAQAVDKVVFSMLTKGETLKVSKKSGLLTDQSRHKLIEDLLERQGTALKYRGEKVLLKHIIKNQVRGVGRYLRGEDDYRCFIGYY